MKIYRRTLTYIMGMAFWKLYPEARVVVNYQLTNAMYCNLENMEVTEEMLYNVQEEMKRIFEKDLKIEKRTMTREEAGKFYEKNNTGKGRLQYDLATNEKINMSYCEDYFNYFYEIIATHTGVTKIFELKKYYDGFLLRYPSSQDVNVLPEYEETKKLSWALHEYETIYKVLNVGTVYRLNKRVKEGSIKELILLSEALHEKKIAQIADMIAADKKKKLVLIAGPSSSGKTTFAQRLAIQLRVNGITSVALSMDNYFVNRDKTPVDKDGNYDFECLEALDLELFNEQLTALLNGEEVSLPTFDFTTGTRVYEGKFAKLEENQVLIVEGIHGLNEKMTAAIPRENKFKIYISALTALNIDDYNRISTADTRLIRRIMRDSSFRGHSPVSTLKMWPSVRNGEEKYIFPYQEDADVMFNSSLIYEAAVIKPFLEPELAKVERSEAEYAEARRLSEFLGYFLPIDINEVPINSILREFLGGGCFYR